MAQQSRPAPGYIAVTVQVTNTAQQLLSVINAFFVANNINTVVPPSVREWQIQLDPEDTSGNSVRMGQGNVGATVGSIVQKGITLRDAGAFADTARSGILNGTTFGDIWVQTVASTRLVNVQIWIF